MSDARCALDALAKRDADHFYERALSAAIPPVPPVAVSLCAACRKPDCQHPDPVFAGITPHSEVQ